MKLSELHWISGTTLFAPTLYNVLRNQKWVAVDCGLTLELNIFPLVFLCLLLACGVGLKTSI